MSCLYPFFKNGTECISSELCPSGTYPDLQTSACELCTSYYKPTNEEYFLRCGNETGIICLEGTFLYNEIECHPCHSKCKSCFNKTEEDCLECKKKYRSVYTESGVLQCQACEEYLPGLYT